MPLTPSALLLLQQASWHKQASEVAGEIIRLYPQHPFPQVLDGFTIKLVGVSGADPEEPRLPANDFSTLVLV